MWRQYVPSSQWPKEDDGRCFLDLTISLTSMVGGCWSTSTKLWVWFPAEDTSNAGKVNNALMGHLQWAEDVKPWTPFIEVSAHVTKPSSGQTYPLSSPVASLLNFVALWQWTQSNNQRASDDNMYSYSELIWRSASKLFIAFPPQTILHLMYRSCCHHKYPGPVQWWNAPVPNVTEVAAWTSPISPHVWQLGTSCWVWPCNLVYQKRLHVTLKVVLCLAISFFTSAQISSIGLNSQW